MEEKLDDNVVKTEAATDVTVGDETKKRIDWMEWMVQDLMYRLSKLENENQVLKDTLQERDYRLSDVDNRCFGLEAKLSDYSKYVLEMSNEYVEKYTHMTLSTD